MNLLVVESPAKAKTINKYLGSDFEVIATVGHFRDLAKKDGVQVSEDQNDITLNCIIVEKYPEISGWTVGTNPFITFPLPPSMVIISPSLIIMFPAVNCFNS